MKRIISVLLILTVMFSTFIVFADNPEVETPDLSEYDMAYQLLSELSVISEDDALTYDSTISRGRFAKIIADCLNGQVSIDGISVDDSGFSDVDKDCKYYTEISYLKMLGVISGDGSGTFRPSDSITFDEALHLMISILGYSDYANEKGGFPAGDYAAARMASVNIKISSDNTCLAILPMVEQCLESNVLEIAERSWSKNSVKYNFNGTVTGLELFFGLRKDEGVLQSSGTETILLDREVLKEKVVIDGVTYSYKNALQSVYVGALVDFWYKVSDDNIKDIFMIRQSSKNDILVIDADNIDDFEDMTYYYSKDSSNKSYKIEITGEETVVYNSKPIETFDETLMIPGNGKVVFINNDKIGKYDVVRIYSYESFVVDSVTKNSNGTYEIYPNSVYGLSSYVTDADISKVFNSSDKEMSFDRVVGGNTIAVYSYKENGKNVIFEAYTSEKKITGDLDSVMMYEDPLYLTIDGEKIRVSHTYETLAKKLNCDYNLTFNVDYYGNIAGYDGDSTTTMAYGYLLNQTYTNYGIDTVLKLKIFSQVGNVIDYDCAEKIWIDGVKYTDLSVAMDRLKGSDGLNNIIRYSVNSDKEINRIDLWENVNYSTSSTNVFNSLKLVNPSSELYLKKSYKNFGGKIKYDDNTKFFALPTGSESVEEGIRILSSKDLISDGYYEISAYTSNVDSILPEVCLVKPVVSKNSGYARGGIISSFSDAYDSESDETRKCIYIEEYDRQSIRFIKDETILKSLPDKTLKRGDIIRYTTNNDGYVETVTLLYRADGDVDVMNMSSVEAFTNGSRYAIGRVFDKDGKYIKIVFGDVAAGVYPSASNMDMYNISNFKKIFIVDTTTNKIAIETGGGINDISAYTNDNIGSKVVLNTEFGEERVLYIIKK